MALVVGSLSLLGGLSQYGSDSVVGGVVMILGALAYRLLKQRRLGLKPDTRLKQTIEGCLLFVCLLAVVLQNNLGERLYVNPFVNVIIPLWTFTAYAVIFFKQAQPRPSDNSNLNELHH